MLDLFGTIFFVCLGFASCVAALFFLLFTCLVAGMLVSSWSDNEFTLKERAGITALFSLVITWGGFLTYLAASYGLSWMLV